MKKLVIKYGNSLVMRFDPEDVKIYNIEEGDHIEIQDESFKVIKQSLNKNLKQTK